LNVVVAVLMDGMSSESPPVEEDEDSVENILKRVEGKLNQLTEDVTTLKASSVEAHGN